MKIKSYLNQLKSAISNVYHKYVTGDGNLIRMKQALNTYRANAIVKGITNTNLNLPGEYPSLIKKIHESGESSLAISQWVYQKGIKGLNVNNTRRFSEKEIELFESIYGGDILNKNALGKITYTEEGNWSHMILDLLRQAGIDVFNPHELYKALQGKSPAELYVAFGKSKVTRSDYGYIKRDPINWIRKVLGLQPLNELEMIEEFEIERDLPKEYSIRELFKI